MNILTYNSGDKLDKIVKKLEEGKLVVYPTDTIYGIAANVNNTEAVMKVYSAKKRELSKPLSVCFHDFNQLQEYVLLNSVLMEIVERLLPGPYTLILYKKECVNRVVTANSSKIGVRIPDNPVSYELTKKFPITSTSANISHNETPDNISQIKEELKDNVDYYIDNGKVLNNQSSTIIDLTGNKPELIRKGFCNEKLLDEILKLNL